VGRKHILIILLVGLMATGWNSASAQLKLGYIDSQKILMTYSKAVDAQKKLEGESNAIVQELQNMEEEIRITNQQLEQQSMLLSDAKKREKAQELQDLYARYQQFQQDKEQEMGQRREELLKPIIDEINATIKTIGEKEGYDMVFDAGSLVHAKESYDLTERVLGDLEGSTTSGTAAK